MHPSRATIKFSGKVFPYVEIKPTGSKQDPIGGHLAVVSRHVPNALYGLLELPDGGRYRLRWVASTPTHLPNTYSLRMAVEKLDNATGRGSKKGRSRRTPVMG